MKTAPKPLLSPTCEIRLNHPIREIYLRMMYPRETQFIVVPRISRDTAKHTPYTSFLYFLN